VIGPLDKTYGNSKKGLTRLKKQCRIIIANMRLEAWKQIPRFAYVWEGKNMANIEEKVEALIKTKIEKLGYNLYDVEYAKEGKDYFLRIYIDGKNGISLTDCEKVTGEINDILDKADYIKEGYFLEVSSTGIERVLRKDKHLEGAIGEEVEIKLFKPIDKQKALSRKSHKV